MELVGLGSVNKATPSPELVASTGATQDEWDHFKAKLIDAIPALKKLEPRYDNHGNVSGYINGPGFLSYHESEIMMLTLKELREVHDIPAYPVHDCLLVKQSQYPKALDVFRAVIRGYCARMSGVPLTVAVSVEGKNVKEMIYEGFYDEADSDQLVS